MSTSCYINLNEHDRQVLINRAISPEVAALRGTHTRGGRMVIPLHNTQGESDADSVIYRPHTPVTGPDGKVRKYLFPTGAEMIIDVHPLSLPYLDDVTIPIIITESALKADAILSAIEPGTYCVVSVSGVWNWVSNGTPLVADFRDIRWRTKEGGQITRRRLVYIAFDSDAADKAGPIQGRWELGSFLERKRANVRLMDVPAAPDGSKQGIDDALKASGPALLHQLIAAAQPVPQIMPAGGAPTTAPNDVAAAAAYWRRMYEDAQATIETLRTRVRQDSEAEAVRRNGKLGAARETGAALVRILQSEKPGRDGATPYRMPLAKLADRTGLSLDTCSKHLKVLATYQTPDGAPVLRTVTDDIPRQVDPNTGEVKEQHKEIWVGPGVEPSAFGYLLANLTPANAPKHGGKPDRNFCPDHPNAGLIRRTKTVRTVTRECAECHTVLSTDAIPVGYTTSEFIPTVAPTQHDAFRHESAQPANSEHPTQHDAFGGNPAPDTTRQDAASIYRGGDREGAIQYVSDKMRDRQCPEEPRPADVLLSPQWEVPTNTHGHDRFTA